MPDLNQFAQGTKVPVSKLREICESQATNGESQVYKKIVAEVAAKWAAMMVAQNAIKARKRTRVYIPFSISSTDRYRVSGVFPQFEINYATARRTSAAFARTVSLCVSEVMLSMVGKHGKTVLVVGFQLRPMLMRNRDWVKFYMPGAQPELQSMYKAEDRDLGNIYASMCHKNKSVPTVMSQYMTGKGRQVQADVFSDETQANVSCFVLDKLDTNFRQLATWMNVHGNKMLLFSIPCNKAMEYGTEGDFSELDAYVVPRGDKVTMLFKDDLDFQRDYTHSNYLELVARTKLVMFNTTFVKEYVGSYLGYAIYKITASKGVHTGQAPAYKSWNEPGYKDKYLLFTPALRPGGSVDIPSDWRMRLDMVDKRIINDVLDMALMNVDGKMDDVIARRINSKAHNYIAQGQLTRKDIALTVEQLEAALIGVYCTSFMMKFKASAAVGALAPQARDAARLARGGIAPAFQSAIGALKVWCRANTVDVISGALTSYISLFESGANVPLPYYNDCPGYTEYTDVADVNPAFGGWIQDTPLAGNSPYLPGGDVGIATQVFAKRRQAFEKMTGTRVEDYEDKKPHEQVGKPTVVRADTVKKTGFFLRFFDSMVQSAVEVEDMLTDELVPLTDAELEEFARECTPINMVELDTIVDRPIVAKSTNLRYYPVEEETDPAAWDELSNAIVHKVLQEHGSVPIPQVPFVYNAFMAPTVVREFLPGSKADDPKADFVSVIGDLFPQSQLMDVSLVESDRMYSDFEVVMRTIRAKMDLSRLEALKPDSFYLPAFRTHVPPKIKEHVFTTMATMAKRNADTPFVMDPSGMTETWDRIRKAMLTSFYVPGAAWYLDTHKGITLDEMSLREWLHKQPLSKRNKLNDDGGYAFEDLKKHVENMTLMLKTKIKPDMDSSYNTSVKLPQSIQFDSTGKSVAVLSPLIRQKVKLQQKLLKPHILVMQRKSREDILNFLNQFDWRPSDMGSRTYIEIDQSLFDKSQVTSTHLSYLEVLRMFGVAEEYLTFIDAHINAHTSSAPKSGVSITLEGQNPSGMAFTLDRNNEASMMAIAELVVELVDKVEFVMIMGDDVTMAVRGHVDIGHWERDMSRRFNFNPKIKKQVHGYFCSFEIVHLPNGRTTIVRDPVKALLSFADLSMSKMEDLKEKWISYVDSMTDVDDLNVQMYLAGALYNRWRLTHPGARPETFVVLLKVHAAIKGDFNHLQSFYATVASKRFY